MANPEHVAELMKGVDTWNQWRLANPKIIPDLFCAKLVRNDLRNYNFYKANLSNANLSGSDLENANLRKANLQEAVLYKVNFKSANLKYADLTKTNLGKAVFIRGNCEHCNFSHAYLVGANLYLANLTEANLQYADLTDADLTEATLFGTVLQEAVLDFGDLENSVLWEVNFRGARVTRANLRGSNMGDAMLEDASFNNSEFPGAKLHIASISSSTSFSGTLFYDCVVMLGKTVDEGISSTVLSRGIVNNVQFADPVFGRKVRDQAWLNKWREDIHRRFPKVGSLGQFFRFRNIGRLLHWLWGRVIQGLCFTTSNYGRNTWPWILWSFGLIFIFAFIFDYLGTENDYLGDQIKPLPGGFWTYFYYSVVTFTTLGFGDITAKTHTGMFWAALEVIIGYVMLGGLISIFATKVARRND